MHFVETSGKEVGRGPQGRGLYGTSKWFGKRKMTMISNHIQVMAPVSFTFPSPRPTPYWRELFTSVSWPSLPEELFTLTSLFNNFHSLTPSHPPTLHSSVIKNPLVAEAVGPHAYLAQTASHTTGHFSLSKCLWSCLSCQPISWLLPYLSGLCHSPLPLIL